MAEIIFTGNLGADAKMTYTRSGSPVLNFRVGDSKSKKLDNGDFETVAQNWFNVELWGSIAEFLAEQLLKGVRVKVYGTFYVREYDGRNGSGISLDVKASAVEVLTSYKDRQKIAGNHPGAQPGGGFGGGQTSGGQGGNDLPPDDPWATPPANNNQGGWG
ncbi:ssDNA-binding protein [Arthrobacter phage Auxilium]|uniref:SsDNA-binding protein n=1 Tax=Arthrobacter phage Auxilium TaxID=2419948 RepID=A0A3G2KA47_9CAUD|nr:ssDNA-binding protein [Arthrobacter phage Auxilium]AYN55844.1 ssDNA-binding protein [Arthrobacter phage Auxilium]